LGGAKRRKAYRGLAALFASRRRAAGASSWCQFAFYRGDIDPRLAIRRTTVYGALGVAFLFLFAGLGNAAEGFLEASLGMAPLAGSIVTGGTFSAPDFSGQ